MDPTLFQSLLSALVLAVVGLLTYAGRKVIDLADVYVKSKVSKDNFDLMKGYAETTVRFFEQSPVFKDLVGEKKKELAILQISTWAKSNHLPIDVAFIDKLIEEAVNLVKAPRIEEIAEAIR
jgi:hypothetical protein